MSLKESKGFTLIEMMIAVAILAMMSLLSWQSMVQMMGSQEISEGRDEELHAVRLTFDKLFFDLSQAFLAGLEHRGTKDAIEIGFIGRESSLNFASFARRSYFPDTHASDQCEIGYTLEADEEGSTYRFMRRESDRIDDKPEEGGRAYPLLEGVQSALFDYYDPKQKEWVREWDSTQVSKHDRLPRAVRVTLTLASTEDEGETVWTSEFPIPLYAAAVNF